MLPAIPLPVAVLDTAPDSVLDAVGDSVGDAVALTFVLLEMN